MHWLPCWVLDIALRWAMAKPAEARENPTVPKIEKVALLVTSIVVKTDLGDL